MRSSKLRGISSLAAWVAIATCAGCVPAVAQSGCAVSTSPTSCSAAAFPGAYGTGATVTTGGRGGIIYHVTNLNDSGTGSFRTAVSAGNRIVVFDVGGYILMNSAISVSSNLTIEGQTAPGGYIGLYGNELSLTNSSNVIIRNLRIRQGSLDTDTGNSAVNLGTSTDIILDHISVAFGEWDSVDAVGAVDFTIQNSLIGDPIVQQFGAHVEVGPSTFYRNLFVSAHNRQPLAKDNTIYINNIVYDFQAGLTDGNGGGVFSYDLVNNYFIAGPSTTNSGDAYFQIPTNISAYSTGNYIDGSADGTLDGSVNNSTGATVLTAPWSTLTTQIPTLSATAAVPSVLALSGAQPHDQLDQLLVSQANSLGKSGSLITDQSQTGLTNGGYGTIPSLTPFPSTPNDGIPDYWASAYGLSTTSASAATAYWSGSGNGYMNIEVYANSLMLPVPWSAADQTGTPLRGASSFNTQTSQWLLTGSGQTVSNGLDQGQFASQPWSGSESLTAELSTFSSSSSSAAAGIMLRGDSTATSAFVALVENGSSGLSLFSRATDGATAQALQVQGISLPVWLRLTQSGSTYSAFWSSNGITWIPVGTVSATIPAATATGGLTLASGSATALGTALFSNVSISTSSAVTLTASSTSYTYPGTEVLTASVTGTSGKTPTGSLQIYDGSTLLTTQTLNGSAAAQWTVSPVLSVGTLSLYAQYLGDTNNPSGTSAIVSVVVISAPVPAVNLAASSNPVILGTSVTFTFSATPPGGYTTTPTGQVALLDGGTTLATLTLGGGAGTYATSALSAGTHTIVASYQGDANYAAATSSSLSLIVQASNVPTVFLTGSGSAASLYGTGTLRSTAQTGGGIGAAVDNNGYLWSIASNGSSLEKISAAGVPLTGFTGGGLSGGTALVIDGAGQIWTTNSNGSLSVFSNSGAAISPSTGYVDSSYSTPTGIAIDVSGNVWVSNAATNTVDEVIGGAAPVAPLATSVQNNKIGATP